MFHSQNSSPFLKRYIGTKAFYKHLLGIVVPIIIQTTVTNFVSLLDNIMVGALGTEQMSGVSIANQLLFVYNLCIFGGLSGAGIFSAQFHGADNHDGVRYTFRFKVYIALFVSIAAYSIFILFGKELISLYLTEDASGDLQSTLDYGLRYLHILYFGMFSFALSQCYASTLRETGETFIPMVTSLIEVAVNCSLNYILIFGKLGFPALNVRGAAIATVISRITGLGILAVYTHINTSKHPFIKNAYASPRIPRTLSLSIIKKGMPLLANEALWSLGTTSVIQQYSLRGMMVVAALNISSTLSNLFNVFLMSMGSAVAIMVGQALGANDVHRAKDYVRKLAFASIVICIVIGAVLAMLAPVLPHLYNTTPDVKALASGFIVVCAFMMPVNAFVNCSYFTLRSGGKTIITFMYDCGFTWLIIFPLAHMLVVNTSLPITIIYATCCFSEILKAVFGWILIRKGIWINNIVGSATTAN